MAVRPVFFFLVFPQAKLIAMIILKLTLEQISPAGYNTDITPDVVIPSEKRRKGAQQLSVVVVCFGVLVLIGEKDAGPVP